ncbi:MAG: collagen binding domain-containing protein, partial [Lysinibacillus sp.]
MRRGHHKTDLNYNQRHHFVKMMSIITLICLLVQTISSPIIPYVNAAGNVLGISLSTSSVNETEALVVTLIDKGEESNGPLSFTVPDGLTISGIVAGQENIETISNGNQTLQFNWTENSNKVVQVQLQAQKAGDYTATFSSSDSTVSANVTVVATVADEVEVESNQTETETVATEEESSDDDESDASVPQDKEELEAVATEEKEDAAETPSFDLDENWQNFQDSPRKPDKPGKPDEDDDTFDHIDIETVGSFKYKVDGVEKTVTINLDSLSDLGTLKIYEGTIADISNGTAKEITIVPEKRKSTTPGYDYEWNYSEDGFYFYKDKTYTVVYDFSVDVDGATHYFHFEQEYTFDGETNICPGSGSSKGIDIAINASDLENIVTKGSLTLSKKVVDTEGNPLNGNFTFDITSEVNNYSNTIQAETKNGSFSTTINGLKAGEYIITEKNPSDAINEYNLNAVKVNVGGTESNATEANGDYSTSATITQGKHQSVTFKNIYEKALGSLEITKVDSESKAPLAGAEFTLYNKETGEAVGDPQITGEDGSVTFSDLAWGTYQVKETNAPTGYQKVTEPVEVTIDQEHTGALERITVTNKRILGTLTVIKVDEDNGNAALAGAEFTLYDKETGDVVGKPQITGEDGTVTFSNLAWGTYQVKETQAPTGYQKVTEPVEVTINQANTGALERITVTNKRILGTLTVIKVDEDNGNAALAGAEFTLYDKETGEAVGKPQITGEDGTVTFSDLAWGTYQVKETQAPTGYQKVTEPVEVTINQANTGELERITVTNKRILGTLTVIKVDEDNGDAALAGAEFTLYNKKTGEAVGDPQITGEDGTVTFSDLAWGTYQVKETQAPTGYQKVTDPIEVTIDQGNTGELQPIIVTNKRILGNLTVVKVDADNENAALAGAEFTLYDKETGEAVGKPQTTGTDGTVEFTGLAWGTYQVKETNAPTGYQKVTEPVEVTIDQEHTGALERITVTNKRILGTLTVVKVDEDTEKALEGAVFTLYNKETGEAVGNPQITGEDGSVTFSDLAWGTYQVKETNAPTGYQKVTEPVEVTIDQEHTGALERITVTNKRILGTLTVVKVDADNENAALAGAKFTLYDKETGDVVGKPQITGEDGTVTFSNLAWGTYQVKETNAPTGYQKVTEPVEVTIDQANTGALERITVTNKRILGTLTVIKVDEDTEKALEGAVFTLYNKETGEAVGNPQITGEDGSVTFSDLAWGTYQVKETNAPTGYQKVTEPVEVTIDQEHTGALERIIVTNKRILGNLTVVKVDADNENAALAGAEFTLYDKETGEAVGKPQTTGTDGTVEFTGLAWGTYQVKETNAPTGYQKVTEPVEVTIDQEHTGALERITVTNKRILGTLTVVKVDEDNENAALAGAEFTLYNKETGEAVGNPQITGE